MVLLAAIWATMAKPVTTNTSSDNQSVWEKESAAIPRPNAPVATAISRPNPTTLCAGGQKQAGGQGTHARGGGQQAQRFRAAVQDIGRHHRHEHRQRHGHHAHQCPADSSTVRSGKRSGHVVQAFLEALHDSQLERPVSPPV